MVNDRLGPLIDDVQQVNGTIQPVPSAAQRLAVQRNQSQAECRCRLGQNHRNPTRQGVLQRGGIDLRQQLPQTARRRRRPLEPQRMKKVNGLFRQPLTDGIIAPGVLKNRTHLRPSEWPQTHGVVPYALWDQELAPSTRASPPEGRLTQQEPPFKKTSPIKLRPILRSSSTPYWEEPWGGEPLACRATTDCDTIKRPCRHRRASVAQR